MPPTTLTLDPALLASWRDSWGAVMAGFVPGMAALEGAIGAAVGSPGRVLDLGGGPGVLAERLAARWPSASVALLDLDPVLLALARGALSPAVTVFDADLTDPRWPATAGDGYDLITAVMTVHYLSAAQIHALYRDARRVLAPGGVLVVADLMPDEGLPTLMSALDPREGEAAAELAWAQWWSGLSSARELGRLLDARARMFRDRPPAGFIAPAAWHVSAARAAGFREAGVLWRDGRHAALAALTPSCP